MSDKTNALLVNHNDILIAKYVSIGDGWVDIADNALNEMRQIDPSVEVNTVKEKFGALRMYFRSPSGNVTELNKVVEEAAEAATLVRMAVMSKFAFIAGRVPLSHKVSFHWWMVLSAAGVKGGISILMLHMLPRGFEHRELFEAVIIGQILLSTFIYPIILMGVIKLFSQKFEAECAEEAHHH